MKVKDFLNLPELDGLCLKAGEKGINRVITTVTVIDTPDGALWLTGGEVVISTGYPMKDSLEQFESYLNLLIEKKVAAFVIKLGRYLKKIPQEMLTLANIYQFPIIACPEKFAFADIINPVLSNLVDKQSSILKKNIEINDTFLQLAISNSRVEEILKAACDFVGRKVAFVDEYFQELYYDDEKTEDYFSLDKETIFTDIGEVLLKYEHFTVANKNTVFGYLLFSLEEESFEQRIFKAVVSQASIVLILHMQMRMSNNLIEKKYSAQFIEDLLLHNIKTHEEIYTKAKLKGWDLSKGGRVIIVDINNIKAYYTMNLNDEHHNHITKTAEMILDIATDEVKKVYPHSQHYSNSDFVAIIVPGKVKDTTCFVEKIEKAFLEMRKNIATVDDFTVSIAIGDYIEDIFNIHESYKQAKDTITYSYKVKKFDQILLYGDVKIYNLIESLHSNPHSKALLAQYIQPLLQYDHEHNSELIMTLKMIMECGYNLKVASTLLYIHYNSIKYRYQKIENLLGVPLNNPQTRFELELAMRLFAMAQ